ncbi:MAG: hypothetical protein KGL35_26815, partial [Bradyrhizobium sp.]|nr:hypothetical protein [Bradyrhizobium sp.]
TKYRESKQTRTDQKRRSIYAQKRPLDLARTMAVIVSAVQVWRDHDPAKFTEFKNLMKERIAP